MPFSDKIILFIIKVELTYQEQETGGNHANTHPRCWRIHHHGERYKSNTPDILENQVWIR